MSGDVTVVEYAYSNLSADSCDFDFGDGVILQGQEEVTATAAEVSVDFGGGVAM